MLSDLERLPHAFTRLDKQRPEALDDFIVLRPVRLRVDVYAKLQLLQITIGPEVPFRSTKISAKRTFSEP